MNPTSQNILSIGNRAGRQIDDSIKNQKTLKALEYTEATINSRQWNKQNKLN